MSVEERAGELHKSGYNCAQSVFGACSGECGVDENTALAVASGFGGGLGCGEICGAITGGVMAIGAAFALDGANGAAKVKRLRHEFIEKIRDEYGAVTCRELKAPGRAVPCGSIIEACAGISREIIENNKKER